MCAQMETDCKVIVESVKDSTRSVDNGQITIILHVQRDDYLYLIETTQKLLASAMDTYIHHLQHAHQSQIVNSLTFRRRHHNRTS